MTSLTKPTTPKRPTVGCLAKLMHTAGGSPQKTNRILYEDSKVTLVKYDSKEPVTSQTPKENESREAKEKIVNAHLSDLHEDGLLCDLTLTIGSVKMNIHKVVLSRCSDKYLNIFTGPNASQQTNEIALPDNVSLDAAKEVVNFMYKGTIHLTKENVAEVLIISAALGIRKLIQRCVDLVKRCSDEHIMLYLNLGNKLQLDTVKCLMIDRAAKHFEAAAQTADFQKLSLEDILAILRTRTPQDASEAVVYAAVLNWLKADPVRTQSALDLLKDIQFDKIDPRHIQLIDTNPDVKQLPEIKKMLREAYKYHTMTLSENMDKRVEHLVKTKRASSYATPFRMPSLVSVGGHFSPENSAHGFVLQIVLFLVLLTCNFISTWADFRHLKATFCKLDVGSHSNRWDFLMNMPEQRSFHCSVFALGQIFVLGGCDASQEVATLEPTNTAFAFCIAKGTWLKMAPMTEKRMMFTAVNFSGLIYALGGIGEQNKALATVECYNPKTNVWSEFPSLPLNCVGACACIHTESIFVIGGYIPTFNRILSTSTVFYFNFEAYRWETKSLMPSKSFFASVVESNGVLYVIGGAATGETDGELTSLSEIYEYDDDSRRWSIVGSLKTPRHSFGAAAIGNIIYVVGGLNYDRMTPLSTIEAFNVETSRSDDVNDLNLPYQLLGSSFCLVDH